MKFGFIVLAALFASACSVNAACPASSPSTKKMALSSGDQKVNDKWLAKTLAGKKLVFSVGTEQYRANGSYRYVDSDGQNYDAPGYKFYRTGFRCIDYPNGARFDFYVVNDGKIVLINGQGNRYVGKLKN